MKKRGILFVTLMALLLAVSGCSSQNNKSTKHISEPVSHAKKVDTKAYDKLSKTDLSKVRFSFKYYLDNNSEGVVSVYIDNQTNKKVSFNQGKFIFKGSHDVKSSKNGIVTISPSKGMSIKNLFTKVDNSFFEEPGLLVYDNPDFKLAYVEQNQKEFDSSNLSNKALISDYKQFLAHRDAWDKQKADYNNGIYGNDSSDSDEDSSDGSDTTDDNSTSQNQTDSSKKSDNVVVHNEKEAESLVEKQEGSAADITDNADGAHYTYNYGMWPIQSTGDKVYWVQIAVPMGDISSYMYNWVVYPDGRVVAGNPNEM